MKTILLQYEYSVDYFERLSLTEARERGDMHASYLVSKLSLTRQGKTTLAEFLLAASQGVSSRNQESIEVKVTPSPKFKFKKPTEAKKRSLF